jgi:hypothetical protein
MMERLSAHRILFKIDASRCALRVGDPVTAGQIIGEDANSGGQVRSAFDGQVEGISFNGGEHTLLVLVKTEVPVAERAGLADPVCLRIDASWCAVQVGDPVMPETIIGSNRETGEKVRAGVRGRVEAISSNGAVHTLVILIQP